MNNYQAVIQGLEDQVTAQERDLPTLQYNFGISINELVSKLRDSDRDRQLIINDVEEYLNRMKELSFAITTTTNSIESYRSVIDTIKAQQ
ncbi:hypothetical protein AGMMS49992_31120 [Clostridia bacterium]|nr:hypothetical protein AGMMS49992_31120 [Clostridia bacterium]